MPQRGATRHTWRHTVTPAEDGSAGGSLGGPHGERQIGHSLNRGWQFTFMLSLVLLFILLQATWQVFLLSGFLFHNLTTLSALALASCS